MAQSADASPDTAVTVLPVLVSADRPGTGAAGAQWPRTGVAAAAAAGYAAVNPASTSEAPATATQENILTLATLMPVMVPPGAETALKRR